MSSPNLKEDLNNYLTRNDKPPITAKIKNNFSNLFNSVKYTRVPNEENGSVSSSSWFSSSENDCCPTMSRLQRIMAFMFCVCMGIFCFGLSTLYIPVLLFKARKFSLLFTLGSLFMIFSFSFLWGPKSHMKHLFSRERMWFTCCYFGTLIATLYFALSVKSTPFTVLCAVAQIIALVWFLFSYIPGGHTGVKFFTRLCSSSVSSSVSKALPV